MKKKQSSVTVQVPATSANLGPGFDSLGVAVKLYNRITTEKTVKTKSFAMVEEAAALYFKKSKVRSFPYSISIRGNVPISRGLGSSVTVRLGFLIGLNTLCGNPLREDQILDLVIELEGHPDNAVPAFLGGFACASGQNWYRHPVRPTLSFVTFIPEMELETKKARAVLPKKVSLADAVTNLQNTALITAAFCTQKYELLQNGFKDTLHQPYRSKLLPPLFPVIEAAQKNGALGGFLSGAGSTLMALTLKNHREVARSMELTAHRMGCKGKALILKADNQGFRIL